MLPSGSAFNWSSPTQEEWEARERRLATLRTLPLVCQEFSESVWTSSSFSAMTHWTLHERYNWCVSTAAERKWEEGGSCEGVVEISPQKLFSCVKFKSEFVFLEGEWPCTVLLGGHGHPRQRGTTLCAAPKVWEGKTMQIKVVWFAVGVEKCNLNKKGNCR